MAKSRKTKKRETGDGRRATKSRSALADAEIIKTQKEAAKYAKVSERTIRRWVTAGMPRTETGHYIKAMLDFYRDNEGNQPTEARAKGHQADAEYKDAKAKLMQMELQVKQGKLVPIDEYLENEVKRHVAVNRSLRALPRILAARVPEKIRRKLQAIAKEEINKILDAFAEGRPIGHK